MFYRAGRVALLIIVMGSASLTNIPCSFAEEGFAHTELVHKLDIRAQQGYSVLLDQFRGLQASVDGYCAKPGEHGFLRLKSVYERSFLAWKHMDYLHTGPVSLKSRRWQIQFWPDPKDIVKRTVEMYLGRFGSGTQLPITNFGVAIKGLPALEYLLFVSLEGRSEEPPEAVCALSRSVAGNLVDVVSGIVQEYPEYIEHTPAPVRLSDYLKSAMTTLSMIEERQLAEPFGVKRGSVVYQLSESWRGGLSLVAAEQNLRGVYRNMINDLIISPEIPTHYARALVLSDRDRELLSLFAGLDFPHDNRIEQRAREMYEVVQRKKKALNSVSAEIFGVKRGFSFNDGD